MGKHTAIIIARMAGLSKEPVNLKYELYDSKTRVDWRMAINISATPSKRKVLSIFSGWATKGFFEIMALIQESNRMNIPATAHFTLIIPANSVQG